MRAGARQASFKISAVSATAMVLIAAVQARAVEIPFSEAKSISAAFGAAWSTQMADLDGDGDLDVLAVARADDTVAWFENDGAPELAFAYHPISTTMPDPRSTVAADLDGDGDRDVLAGGAAGILWFRNDGGTPPNFASRIVTDAILGVNSVAAGDLDGDGDLDVLSAAHSSSAIAWFENDGTALPGFIARPILIDPGDGRSVIATDLDRDGDLDAVSALADSDEVVWHRNDGGTPPIFNNVAVVTGFTDPQSVVATDVDLDGDVDLVSASSGDDTIAWHENDGASPPTFAPHPVSTSSLGAEDVVARDLDGDGDTDLLVASADDDAVRWYENLGGTSPAFRERALTISADLSRSVSAGDLDSDGDVDVLAVAPGDDTVAWFDNRAIHRSALLTETAPLPSPGQDWTLIAADVDGDGDTDLFAHSTDPESTLAWYENDSSAPPDFVRHEISDVATQCQFVAAADLDGDSDVDILIPAEAVDELIWYENSTRSGGGWTAHSIPSPSANPCNVATADFDADGDADVLVSSTNSWMLTWYENGGGSPPQFTPHDIANIGHLAVALVTTDLDGDGDIDFLLEDNQFVGWYENDGDSPPTFIARTVGGPSNPDALYAADLDNDGDVDAMSVHIDSFGEINIYVNDGGSPPLFTKETIAEGCGYPIVAADVDRDGDADLLHGTCSGPAVLRENLDAGSLTFGSAVQLGSGDLEPIGLAPADVDSDGNLDVFVGHFGEPAGLILNGGGQFAFTTIGTAPTTLVEGASSKLLDVTAEHLGREGDTDAEVATLELRIEDGAGVAMNSAQANAIIERLTVYRDDGSGSLDVQTDAVASVVDELALVDGVQTTGFGDGQPEPRVEFGKPVLLFVTLELTEDAADSSVNDLVVTHLTESSSTAEDRDNDIPLVLQFAENVSTNSVEIAAPDSGRVLPSTPLTLARTKDGIALDWGPSCAASDEDFAIYFGSLGDFQSHTPLMCSTSGASSAIIDAPAGSVYFLIVPSSGALEGSYGLTSEGAERPASSSACRVQILGACD